jgi:hypothetical protein
LDEFPPKKNTCEFIRVLWAMILIEGNFKAT